MQNALGWATENAEPGRRVWSRPLGLTESAFYYDHMLNGTATTSMNVHLRTTDPSLSMFSPENVRRAWSSVRQRLPLLCTRIEERRSPSPSTDLEAQEHTPHFVLHEADIQEKVCETLSFGSVGDPEEVDAFIQAIQDGPRYISRNAISRMHILHRADCPAGTELHVVFVLAHCITDSLGTSTVLRSFFDTLASKREHPYLPLEARLGLYRPLEEKVSYGDLSMAQRRWRRAIGWAIHSVRKRSIKGGHTLPWKLTTRSASTPARSRLLVHTFTRGESDRIIASCRRARTTLNAAYYVLGQVALARVLARRYLAGEMSAAEWTYRTREPMFFYGPLNLRPYLEQPEGGTGMGDMGMHISWYEWVLPHMPLGPLARVRSPGEYTGPLADGAPPFEALMGRKRFFHRCALLGDQADKMFRHPRFVDVAVASHAGRAAASKKAALEWLKEGEGIRKDAEEVRPERLRDGDHVCAQSGSSLGDMDFLIPRKYPLPSTHPLSPLSPNPSPIRAGYPPSLEQFVPDHEKHPAPNLFVDYWRTHLHARPLSLYFGAATLHQRLEFFAFIDENVFAEQDVKEMVREIIAASEWYLGRDERKVDAMPLQSRL
ncbi:hypothetical protein CONPUDRAFT_157435 [Coniophora puteana RWD-64-598 SS2]|uniref:CoA-dependent acyltransferase n=1 Tax=Coniophora puteana (strain RWD-64-598) TaxID=741705 RepID=A0A5M3MEE9_CONPW|nr:uncharacterized protein CONPUDRAFT_157435 [Coniophora puteana RWD-64-598 SS2]EIW77174.1 hypothetical protein CONPUDRAFT_157435 [Coniophora puteana RWD-64-598 SS2]